MVLLVSEWGLEYPLSNQQDSLQISRMDESWRMRMGLESSFPAVARKSMDEYPTRRSTPVMEAEDFADVFGGPPRSVLSRKFSGDFTRSTAFYDEIFQQPPEFGFRRQSIAKSGGRRLPASRVPEDSEVFYGDVLGLIGNCGGGLRRSRERSGRSSRWKSKSNSSSVLSSEDVSPNWRAERDDVILSSFASKLRPINIPTRNRTSQQKPTMQGFPAFSHNYESDNNIRGGSSHCSFSRRVSSPETISLEPTSFRSVKFSSDDLGPSSPASSPVSLECKEAELSPACGGNEVNQQIEEEDDEDASSYVIEINSDQQHHYQDGGSDSLDIDEAIAWAKETFMRQDGKEESVKEQDNEMIEIEKEKTEEQNETELLNEDITLWSTGNETDIRLLLSTLHHILWPNSGWYAVPLANLEDGLQIKKAYQKARLCLHPDKLQQRGATLLQKYVAERAFSILQDAWAAYISQDGLSN